MTALVEGVRSGTPIVLFAGDTDQADPDHPQNIDQQAVVAATGAGFEQLRSLAHIASDVGRAVWRATVESRPIVLNMPSQLQWAEGECKELTIPWPAPQAVGPDPEALDRALGIVASANRPIVLAGRGAGMRGSRSCVSPNGWGHHWRRPCSAPGCSAVNGSISVCSARSRTPPLPRRSCTPTASCRSGPV